MSEDLRLIAIDDESVVANTTLKNGGMAHSIGEESAGCLDSLKVIQRINSIAWIEPISSGLKDLTELEGVGALTTPNSETGKCVIKDEGVVALTTLNINRFNLRVVVYTLDKSTENRQEILINLVRSDHSAITELVGAEEEDVVIIVSEDADPVVSSITLSRIITDLDGRCRETCESDLVKITAVLAFQGEAGSNAGLEGLDSILVVVDPDDVISTAALDDGRSADGTDVDDVSGDLVTNTIDDWLVTTENLGLASVSSGDEESVTSIGKAQRDGLDTLILHTGIHAVA